MLNMTKTRQVYSTEMTIVKALPPIPEGCLLRQVQEDGIGKVNLCTTTATDVIAGISMHQHSSSTTGRRVEKLTVPAAPGPYTVTTAKTPLSPSATTVSAAFVADGSALAYNAANGAQQYSISGNTVTFNAADAGKEVYLAYGYTPTALESSLAWGDNPYGGTAGPEVATGRCGVLKIGQVATDMWDPAANWFAPVIKDIAAGANGMITRGGTGAKLAATVLESPQPNSPWLLLEINLTGGVPS